MLTLPLFFVLTTAVAVAVAVNPEDSVGFAANSSIPVAGILKAAQTSKGDPLATFQAASGPNVTIFGDWLHLPGVSAFHWISDMQVDCDGVDFNCTGNQDGQPYTSFGRLNASQVPFYVIPAEFHQQEKKNIKPNALGAIICNHTMFFGIFGDEDGDTPENIGESSILLAQTCFPHDHMNGANGHDAVDVAYIMFGNVVPKGVGEETIDIKALKTLGDIQATLLADALGVK